MTGSGLDTFRKFKAEVQSGNLRPAYTLCGEERFLVDAAVRTLVDAVVAEENRDWNFDQISAAGADAQDLVSAAMTYPMFGDRRVLVVTEFEATSATGLAVWQQYLQKPASSTIVVFRMPGVRLDRKEGRGQKSEPAEGTSQAGEASAGGSKKRTLSLAGLLRRYTAVFSFDPLRDFEAASWVTDRLRELGKSISPEAAQVLVEQAGTDLQVLHNEIEKLVLSVGERSEVTSADVEDVVVGQRGFTLYHLRDAVGEQDLSRALQILHRLLDYGVPETVILHTLSEMFLNMAAVAGLVRKGVTAAQIAEELDLQRREWLGERYRKFTRAYLHPEGRLRRALDVLARADLALKLSYQNKRRILELAVYCLVRDKTAEVFEAPELSE